MFVFLDAEFILQGLQGLQGLQRLQGLQGLQGLWNRPGYHAGVLLFSDSVTS